MKTSQAVRNIRKFKKHQTSGIKGRMITDDYGNRYSVTTDPKAKVARRHTLSRGKKRAIRIGGGNVNIELRDHAKRIKNHDIFRKGEKGVPEFVQKARHASSALRRHRLGDKIKSDYHYARNQNYSVTASDAAKQIHRRKRKPKDFTK